MTCVIPADSISREKERGEISGEGEERRRKLLGFLSARLMTMLSR